MLVFVELIALFFLSGYQIALKCKTGCEKSQLEFQEIAQKHSAWCFLFVYRRLRLSMTPLGPPLAVHHREVTVLWSLITDEQVTCGKNQPTFDIRLREVSILQGVSVLKEFTVVSRFSDTFACL